MCCALFPASNLFSNLRMKCAFNNEREQRIEVEKILESIFFGQSCRNVQPQSLPLCQYLTLNVSLRRPSAKVSGFPRLFVPQTVSETEVEMTELQAALWLEQILYLKQKIHSINWEKKTKNPKPSAHGK